MDGDLKRRKQEEVEEEEEEEEEDVSTSEIQKKNLKGRSEREKTRRNNVNQLFNTLGKLLGTENKSKSDILLKARNVLVNQSAVLPPQPPPTIPHSSSLPLPPSFISLEQQPKKMFIPQLFSQQQQQPPLSLYHHPSLLPRPFPSHFSSATPTGYNLDDENIKKRLKDSFKQQNH